MPHDHSETCPGCQVPDLAFATHDHGACQSDALSRAEALAAERGVRFTPVRRRVLEILLEAHKALGAYDVLTRLSAEGFGNQPPVAYRALEFLEEQGFAHRIRLYRLHASGRDPCAGLSDLPGLRKGGRGPSGAGDGGFDRGGGG